MLSAPFGQLMMGHVSSPATGLKSRYASLFAIVLLIYQAEWQRTDNNYKYSHLLVTNRFSYRTICADIYVSTGKGVSLFYPTFWRMKNRILLITLDRSDLLSALVAICVQNH